MKLIVERSGALHGRASVPGDKSIGHRTLIFGALARGQSTVRGFSGGEDNRATLAAFQEMGVRIDEAGEEVRIEGVGLRGLRMAQRALDCGNSGTTMRLLAGLLVGQRFGTRLVGDASLSKRPMNRIVSPLRARGAHIAGCKLGSPARAEEDAECYSPLSIAPLVEGEHLAGIEYDMPVASAQVKSCLLLSGLYASAPTILQEPTLSRDHTERMMLSLGCPLDTAGSAVVLDPSRDWSGGWDGFDWDIPGDISGAAFLLAAGLAIPGSEIVVEGVGVNPTRTGMLDLLRLMRANVQQVPKPEGAGGEPIADLHVFGEAVVGSLVGGEMLVRMIDEVPALCALAASAKGTTEIRDAAELRVKESDRIAVMAKVLTAFGVPVEELPDGMVIQGGHPLHGAIVDSEGDHRIAMAAAILGMQAEGTTTIENADCIATSFPRFDEVFRELGANIHFSD